MERKERKLSHVSQVYAAGVGGFFILVETPTADIVDDIENRCSN